MRALALRPVDPEADAELVHAWVTHPRSAFWMMQEATPAEVERELRAFTEVRGRAAYLGLHDGVPAFLVERYDAAAELRDVYPARPGDVGMHLLVAPTDTPVHGFTRAVMVAVMDLLFSDPRVRRVVVEPDVRNTAIDALNAYVGFRVVGVISLPGKDASLSICTRADYRAASAARAARASREGGP